MTKDPISDMMISLKNAQMAGLSSVSIPFSQLKWSIAEKLKDAGYIKSLNKKGRKLKKLIDIELIYEGKKPRIKQVKRISKPSCRVYHRLSQVRPIRHGYGLAMYSTSKGVLTDQEVRDQGVGGEVMFQLW